MMSLQGRERRRHGRKITCIPHWARKYNSVGKDITKFACLRSLKNGGGHRKTIETQLRSWSWHIALLTTILASKLLIGYRSGFSGRFHGIFGVFMVDIFGTYCK